MKIVIGNDDFSKQLAKELKADFFPEQAAQ